MSASGIWMPEWYPGPGLWCSCWGQEVQRLNISSVQWGRRYTAMQQGAMGGSLMPRSRQGVSLRAQAPHQLCSAPAQSCRGASSHLLCWTREMWLTRLRTWTFNLLLNNHMEMAGFPLDRKSGSHSPACITSQCCHLQWDRRQGTSPLWSSDSSSVKWEN